MRDVAPCFARDRREGARGACASATQRALWRLQRSRQALPLNVSSIYRLRGTLDVAALKRAVGRVAERQQLLTTSFAGDDEPIPRRSTPPELRVVDASGAGESRVAELYDDEVKRPFDLERGECLFRPLLVRTATDEHALVFVLHRLICDRRSLAILLEDLASAYAAELGGPDPRPLPAQYFDVAAVLDAPAETAASYWEEQLADLPELRLSAVARDGSAAAPDDYHSCSTDWSSDLASALREHCAAARTTPFIATAAALAAALDHLRGIRDLPLTAMFQNRTIDAAEPVVGPISHALVLRVRTRPGETLATLEAQIRRTLLEAIAHRAPLELLGERLRPRGTAQPIAPVWLDVVEPPPQGLPRFGAATTTPFPRLFEKVEAPGRTLNVYVHRRPDAVRITGAASAAVLDEDELREIVDEIGRKLAAAAADGSAST